MLRLRKANGRIALAACALLHCWFYPPPIATNMQSLNGLWRAEGYGLLVEIRGSRMRAFEITSISCLSSWSAERRPAMWDGKTVIFAGEAGTLEVSSGKTNDEIFVRRASAVSSIHLERAANRPELCDHPSADIPANNYAVFWQTFAEQYALFPVYRVDWNATDEKYRPQVRSATTPEELFEMLCDMVEPFHNAHIFVRAKAIQKECSGYRPSPDILERNHAQRIAEIIEGKYVASGMRMYCNRQVQFGLINRGIGYLRVLSFEDYTEEKSAAGNLLALDAALDEIFDRSQDLTGLIVDIRINEGGSDRLGIVLASRLAREKYLGYSKVIRNNLDGPLRFTKPQPVWVVPGGRPGFKGKVVLLAGADTLSAGETFTMALMGRRPTVIRVGDDTQGVFSDELRRTLPNGWRFSLPNEVFVTERGRAFDAIGVPPNIRVPVFSDEDLRVGRDAALDKALEILGR